jgi:hypothetical protein
VTADNPARQRAISDLVAALRGAFILLSGCDLIVQGNVVPARDRRRHGRSHAL